MTVQDDINRAYICAARSLGATLRDYARHRRDDDKKTIAILHNELAMIHRNEEQIQKDTK